MLSVFRLIAVMHSVSDSILNAVFGARASQS